MIAFFDWRPSVQLCPSSQDEKEPQPPGGVFMQHCDGETAAGKEILIGECTDTRRCFHCIEFEL